MFSKSLAFGVYIMETVFRASDLIKIAGLTLWFEGAFLTQRRSYVIAKSVYFEKRDVVWLRMQKS